MRHKGIVVEIAPKGKVIILTPQGEFLKVPFRKHVQVGQEIRYTPRRERLSVWQLAAAAVLFLALVGSWPMLSERLVPQPAVPAFTVTLDLDSSFELTVSADGRVLGVEGLNRSGRELAQNVDVLGTNVRDAILTLASRSGGTQAVVTVAAQQDGGAAEVREKNAGLYTDLERTIVEALRAAQLVDVRIWEVPRSFQAEARLAGIVPSRYLAIQRPANPVVPLKIETRLTMTDDVPVVEEVSTQLASAGPVPTKVMEPPRPALTPARWTRQAGEATPASIYNVSFPIAAAKGDY
ncbi:MAG TPA: anti-sigma factor domain-containing protein [Limnochordia bacterium]|nr:anti-sigma factor domain-containing protein [Limnochordia bacterium]